MNNKKKVLIVGSDFLYKRLFNDVGFEVVSPHSYDECLRKDIDLVLFTGGEDIHPKYYKGIHTNISSVNLYRDQMDQNVFQHYLNQGVKMTGICRGLQLLNVMCGGKMYQHITDHAGVIHNIIYPITNIINEVTSTHHQLVILPEDSYPIAWSFPSLSHIYIGPNAKKTEAPRFEIEAAVFPKFNCFGVQFHPEMMMPDEEGSLYYKCILADFIDNSINTFVNMYGYKEDHKMIGV